MRGDTEAHLAPGGAHVLYPGLRTIFTGSELVELSPCEGTAEDLGTLVPVMLVLQVSVDAFEVSLGACLGNIDADALRGAARGPPEQRLLRAKLAAGAACGAHGGGLLRRAAPGRQ